MIRQCGWCDADISHMSARATYCSRQHKKNAASKRHRDRNPGYYARYSRSDARLAYNATHIEKRRAYARERARAIRSDPTTAALDAARRAEWWLTNRDLANEYQRRRRARQKGNPGSVGVALRDWVRLVIRYRGRCAYCGRLPQRKLHMDHVIPLERGGRHAIGNVLPACEPCNLSKSDALLVEWRARS